MSGRLQRTIEVDKLLTRQLFLRNIDNTPPQANQLILTDGQGGTYYSDITPSTSLTGFNEIYLADTKTLLSTPLKKNTLTLKQGPGVNITSVSPNTIIFKVVPIVPSTFSLISTNRGVLYASGESSIMNIEELYGGIVNVSSNKLLIGSYPSFNIINYSTNSSSAKVNATDNLSTLTLVPGFGINLSTIDNATIQIGTNFGGYALNSLTTPHIFISSYQSSFTSSMNFPQEQLQIESTIPYYFNSTIYGVSTILFSKRFNDLNLTPKGNIQIFQNGANSVEFLTHSFSQISTPSGTYSASTSQQSLNILQGHGLKYTVKPNSVKIDVSVVSSFNFISTYKGIISTPFKTNTLTINKGHGIDYDISDQNLTIKVDGTFIETVYASGGPKLDDDPLLISSVADLNSKLYLETEYGIQYRRNPDNGALIVNGTDFDRIDISGAGSLYSVNTVDSSVSTIRKFVKFVPGTGISISGDNSENTITINATGISTVVDRVSTNAYAYFSVYSTATFLDQNVSNFSKFTLTARTPQEMLNVVGVAPMVVKANSSNALQLFYIGLDQSTLLSSVNTQLSSINTLFSSISITNDGVRINNISTNKLNISSLSILGSLVLSSNPSQRSLLTVSHISSQTANLRNVAISTISASNTTNPLVTFDYINSNIGINTINQPQATLEVNGILLARNYATYSDSTLKDFSTLLEISSKELEILKPWNFTWLSDKTADIGFSAEQVERVVPCAVKIGQNGLRMVDYTKLSVVALAACRDLNSRIEIIESTLKIHR